MTKTKKRFFTAVLMRILFYGLFFAGPCLLTESHSVHVRAKIECAKIEDSGLRKKLEDEFRMKVGCLDFIGAGCFAFWILWLAVLLGKKVSVYLGKRRHSDSSGYICGADNVADYDLEK